ncbi:MAG: SGNH/GDSL hydrolase family protein [Bryobacteraceae bacterium]
MWRIASALLALWASANMGLTAADIRIGGNWTVAVSIPGGAAAQITIAKPDIVGLTNERYEKLPDFDAKMAPWRKGLRLNGVVAEECTVQGALDPESLVVRDGASASAKTFQRGVDYEADLAAGTVGRVAGGAIAADQPVFISYRYARQRIDSIVQSANGNIFLKQGIPHVSLPAVPPIEDGETRLANVFLTGHMSGLSEDNLFPILESAYPEPSRGAVSMAEQRLPRMMAKLRSGAKLKVLAWGDSVSTYKRYQTMFVDRLKQRFPGANIELVTEAWGGRNTGSYLKEPPGSEHNYQEKVLQAKPDLIISEFVNDAGLSETQVEERYSQLLADFKGIGAEWIILTPHYIRPDWMKLTRQRDIDEDPRPYVKGVRQFAERHGVAVADASARYGRLWRQGIPYLTLMENNINHPNLYGHGIFADSLMALFPVR